MIDVAVEASAPRAYWGVALAIASRGDGEELPKVSCLVVSSLGHLRSQSSIACKEAQWVCGRIEEVGEGA